MADCWSTVSSRSSGAKVANFSCQDLRLFLTWLQCPRCHPAVSFSDGNMLKHPPPVASLCLLCRLWWGRSPTCPSTTRYSGALFAASFPTALVFNLCWWQYARDRLAASCTIIGAGSIPYHCLWHWNRKLPPILPLETLSLPSCGLVYGNVHTVAKKPRRQCRHICTYSLFVMLSIRIPNSRPTSLSTKTAKWTLPTYILT